MNTKILTVELPKPSSFAFGFEQREDVAFAHGSLDVADDLSVLFSDELDLDLCTLALGASASEDDDDARQNVLLVHFEDLMLLRTPTRATDTAKEKRS